MNRTKPNPRRQIAGALMLSILLAIFLSVAGFVFGDGPQDTSAGGVDFVEFFRVADSLEQLMHDKEARLRSHGDEAEANDTANSIVAWRLAVAGIRQQVDRPRPQPTPVPQPVPVPAPVTQPSPAPETQPTPPPVVVVPPPAPSGDVIANLITTARTQVRKLTAQELATAEDYALSKGEYAPPAGIVPTEIRPGTDLTKLARGQHFWALPGAYPFPNGVVSAHVYATLRGACTIAGKDGQQARVEGGLYGFSGTGGGLKDRLNDNAAVLVGDNARFVGNTWRKALGVAIAGGQVKKDASGKTKVASADGAKVIGCLIENNGSAGLGGKFDNSELAYNVFHHNNETVKDSDGGLVGKFSRSQQIDFHHNIARFGLNAGFYGDISNGPARVTDNIICDIKLTSSDKPWMAVGIKTEISIPGWQILRNYIVGTQSYCIDLNETYSAVVADNVLEEPPPSRDSGVIGLRNLARSDKPSDLPPHSWELGNIEFARNALLKGFGTITGSGTGDKLSLSKFGIVVHDNVGEVRYDKIGK